MTSPTGADLVTQRGPRLCGSMSSPAGWATARFERIARLDPCVDVGARARGGRARAHPTSREAFRVSSARARAPDRAASARAHAHGDSEEQLPRVLFPTSRARA